MIVYILSSRDARLSRKKLLTLECEDDKILLVAKEQPFEMKKRWLTSRTRCDSMIEKLV